MENEVQDILIGTVEDISFYNDTTGFCVAEVNTGEEGVTVVGTVGEHLMILRKSKNVRKVARMLP